MAISGCSIPPGALQDAARISMPLVRREAGDDRAEQEQPDRRGVGGARSRSSPPASAFSSMVPVTAARKPVDSSCAWSWPMPKAPMMSGSATLTMVETGWRRWCR